MNDDQQPKPEDSEEVTSQFEEPTAAPSESNEPVVDTPTPFAQPTPPIPPVAPVAPPPMPQSYGPGVPQPAPGYAPQPPLPGVAPVENPGQGYGIAGIILGVLAIWPVGLPLSIVSMVKSSKANASKTLGIVGLVLNILASLATVFILLIAIIGFAALSSNAHNSSSSSSSTSSSVTSLDTNYAPSTEVYFSVPTTMSGWNVTKVNEDGVNEFTKSDSTARFMTYQGTQSQLTGGDRETTASAMTLYVSEMKATTVPNTDSTDTVSCTSGKLLQFMTRQVTLTSDGAELKGIVAVRMYEGHELSVIYLATTDEFSFSEWYDLLGQVSIADGTD